MLFIRLFGVFDFSLEDGTRVSLKSKKSEAVLLCLALSSDNGYSREQLSNLLWPDLPEEKAKAGLRQALSRIRRICGELFETPKSGWISLDKTKTKCDLWDFRIALRRSSVPLQTEWPTDPFLVSYPEPTDLFSNWLDIAKQSCRTKLVRDARSKLSEHECQIHVKEGVAQSLLFLDPFDEYTISLILEFLEDCGRKRQFLSVYSTFKKRLKDLYELDPSEKFVERFGNGPNEKKSDVSAFGFPDPNLSKFGRPTLNINQFVPVGDDPSSNYLCMAVTEEIIYQLSSQNWFTVKTQVPSLLYSPPSVGQQRSDLLSNIYSMEGTLLKNSDHIRLSIRLIDESSGGVFWARNFECRIENLLGIQSSISASLAELLSTNVLTTEAEKANDQKSNQNDIWIDTMKARYLFWRMNKTNNAEAKKLLDKVLKESTNPTVPALVTASFVRLMNVWSLWSKDIEKELSDAIRIARRSTRVSPHDPWTFFTLGTVLGANSQTELALSSLDRALTMNSNFAPAIGTRGKYKIFLGDITGAKKDLETAINLNSMDTHFGLWQNAMGIACFLENDIDKSLKWANRAIATNPYWAHNYLLTACCFQKMGDTKRGSATITHVEKYMPTMTRENLKYSFPFLDSGLADRFFNPLIELGLNTVDRPPPPIVMK